MKFDKEILWKKITELSKEEIEKRNELVASDLWYRPSYHIAPPNGLLNDPNGLVYINGEHYWHYQWSPLQPYHGFKHWRLVSTNDFVNYKDHGTSVIPDTEDEKHGAFSGSAYTKKNGEIKIYYTGNIEDENGHMLKEVQIMADFENDKIVNKRLVVPHDDNLFTAHARDPKIFDIDGKSFMTFGVQKKKNKKGALALYETTDYENFKYYKTLDASLNNVDYGFMWECPSLDILDGKILFLMSAQGFRDEDNKYELNNAHNVVYTQIDELDLKNNKLGEKEVMVTMDSGHDFYAPQTYWANKKLILVGWLGGLDLEMPTDKYSWHAMLTIPRELSWNKNILVQKPLDEFKNNILKSSESKTFNQKEIKLDDRALHLEFNLKDELTLKIKNDKNEELILSFTNKEIILDRSNMTENVNWNFGDLRQALRKYKDQTVEIYIDNSAIEIFADNYQTIFSSRFFIKDFNKIELDKNTEITVTYINKSKFN